jgi:hypothetical protein
MSCVMNGLQHMQTAFGCLDYMWCPGVAKACVVYLACRIAVQHNSIPTCIRSTCFCQWFCVHCVIPSIMAGRFCGVLIACMLLLDQPCNAGLTCLQAI